ncbi:hypothetical protein [Variovorax sp. W2I14]|uniref:hypothetical protein n=1 Tax=Variovorax sp. W2I14 TaxID=3042290 RepID=UPI003D1DB4FD
MQDNKKGIRNDKNPRSMTTLQLDEEILFLMKQARKLCGTNWSYEGRDLIKRRAIEIIANANKASQATTQSA